MASFISTIVRSHYQMTGPEERKCISSFDRRSSHHLCHVAFLSKHPLTQPRNQNDDNDHLCRWPWSWLQTSPYSCLLSEGAPDRWSVTTRNLVSEGRVDNSIQLHQKRIIISNLPFPSWYSFHTPGVLPVSSTVPANYKVLWLSVTHVNVKVIFWHQIHIMENETVPVCFF